MTVPRDIGDEIEDVARTAATARTAPGGWRRGELPARCARIAGWALLVVGVGHLSVMAATMAGTPDPARERAVAAMRQARVVLPGPPRDLDQLFIGFSVMMAALAIGFGWLVLRVVRRAERSPGPLATDLVGLVLRGCLAIGAVGTVISVALFPAPPIAALGVATAAAATGLIARHRQVTAG